MTAAAAVAILATSCTSTPSDPALTRSAIPAPDTTGLAQFQQWKAQNELASMNQYMAANAAAQQPATRTIIKYVPRRTSSSHSTVYRSTSESSNSARAVQRRGWSKAAKGAVIGGAGGAVIGAVISRRNPVLGGVLGGVLGAGAGYGIGHGMDKKDGRY